MKKTSSAIIDAAPVVSKEDTKALLLKLQANPNYQEFRELRKESVLPGLFYWLSSSTIAFAGIVYYTRRDIIHGKWISPVISTIVCIIGIVLYTKMFRSVLRKPVCVAEGIIKAKRVSQDDSDDSAKTWYLVLDNNGQEYWGKCVTSCYADGEKKHPIGERVLYFSLGTNLGNDDRYIIFEQ